MRFIGVLLAATIGQAGVASVARVEMRDREPFLVMPGAMAAALQQFDPGFRVRRLIDYPPWMWRLGCTQSPDCSRNLYRPAPGEAPFAVVGDFNSDGIPDAVLDGDSPMHGRRIALLSDRQGFQATEIEEMPRISEAVESSRADGGQFRDWDDGVGVGLSAAAPGVYKSSYEPQPLTLTTAGFLVSYFDKASVLYYLRNGQWHRYTISD